MFWRKRRREMVRIFQEQAEHLHNQQEAAVDRQLTPEELQALEANTERLRKDIQKIAPPLPLTFKEWLLRGAVLFVFVLAAGAVAGWKYGLIPASIRSTVSGQAGGAVESQYVPVTATTVRDFPLVSQTSRGELMEIDRSASLVGNVVGVFPDDASLLVFYTKIDEDGLVRLTRRRIDADGKLLGTPVTFASEQSILDASVLPLEDGWVIATTLATDEGPFLLIESYNVAFEPTGMRALLRPLDNETFDGLSLAASLLEEAPYVLLTLDDPGDEGAITDTRRIVLRRFTSEFQLTTEEVLLQPNMNADSHAFYLPNADERTSTGFTILTNGGEPFEYDRLEKGDEIMALTYDEADAPVEFFRLTNNGRPHDYWPESALQEEGYLLFTYVKQMLAPNADTAGQYVFPSGTGNVLFAVVDALTFETVGTLLVTDYQVQPIDGGEAKVGATRPAIAKMGKRLYVLFDEYTVDDPYADTPIRRVLVQAIDLNR